MSVKSFAHTAVVFESVGGLESKVPRHAHLLVSVPGVGAVLVGSWDLSTSLGVSGEVNGPEVTRAVVLAVGARFSGQASSDTPTSRWTSAIRASVDFGLPVMETSFAPMRLTSGRIVTTSSVSPE